MNRRGVALAWVAALTLVGASASAAEPGDVSGWIADARAAAAADRNAEAAASYEGAIAADPARRNSLLVDWANQLTWSGHAVAAIPLYREFLSGDPSRESAQEARRRLALSLAWAGQLDASRREYETVLALDPGDRVARLGRAQTLSWQDQQALAMRAYEEVLQQDAGNAEALRGLARVQSWRGKQRDARRRLDLFLRDHPGDAEASIILAEAQHWMGRSDLALDTLRRHHASRPADSRARELLDRIEFGLRPNSLLRQEESHQSDHLRISKTIFAQDFFFNDGLTTVGPRYQFLRYDPRASDPVGQIDVQRPGIHGRHRIGDALEINGDLFVDIIDAESPAGGGSDDTILTYAAWVSYWPNDLLRFDVGSSRVTFDNTRSLEMGITAVDATASMDIVPDEKTRFSVRIGWSEFSDGNQRARWQLEATRRVLHQPVNLVVGYRYTGMDFSEETGNGYFEPDWFHANELTAKSEYRAGSRLGLTAEASAGIEGTKSKAAQLIWSAGARADYELAERLFVQMHYHFFSSEQASSGGFSRGTGGAEIRFVW